MPVIPAAGLIWAGLAAFAATTLGSMVIGLGVSYGIGYVAQKFGGKDRDDLADAFKASIKTNKISNTAPLPIICGERELGGTEYRSVSGEDNNFLWRVLVLGEGEIDSVSNVYLNGRDVDTDPEYAPLVEWWLHTGTDGQAADANMVTEVEDWGPDHRGFGVAYIVVKMKFDASVFSNGLPTLTAQVKGVKVYDPRDPAQDYDDKDTWKWSENPALHIRNYLTNGRYGRGIDASYLDDATFIDAANHCDELVTVKNADGTDLIQKRYTCNGVINPDQTSLDIIQQLCTSCRGVIVTGDKYKLRLDRAESTTFAFTEDNIVGSWNITGPGARTMLNRVNARFFDSSNNWEEALQVTDSGTYRDQDNGRTYEAELSFPFTSQVQRADILAQHHIKQSRQGWRASFTATIEALQTEVMDKVTITHPTPGWVAKEFRIHSLELLENDLVEVVVQEYDSSVYTFDLHTPPASPDTNLPDPFSSPPPQNLTLLSGTDQLLIPQDGTIITRILAEWDAPTNPFVIDYEIGFKLTSSEAWTNARTAVRSHFIAPVADGQQYDVRVRAVYSNGRTSAWLEQVAYTVIGKTEPPIAPASFSAVVQRDYTRLFSWALNTADSDVAGYQIRYAPQPDVDWDDGLAWVDGEPWIDKVTPSSGFWDIMTPLHTGLLTASPWETTQLYAGTFIFAIKTLDTTGNESEQAVYIVVELFDPPLTSVLYTEYPHLLGWPGTLSNCIKLSSGTLVATDTKDWSDFATDGVDWEEWTAWVRAGNNLVYEHSTIDLGASQIFRPVIRGEAEGDMAVQISHSLDDVTYSGWITPSGDITARYMKAKITVTGDAAKLYSTSIIFDGQQTVDDINDLDTSTLTGSNRIAVGDIRIPTTSTYSTITSINVALQNTGGGWSWEVVDKATANGPRIKIYDNTSTLADATIDATIKGF